MTPLYFLHLFRKPPQFTGHQKKETERTPKNRTVQEYAPKNLEFQQNNLELVGTPNNGKSLEHQVFKENYFQNQIKLSLENLAYVKPI